MYNEKDTQNSYGWLEQRESSEVKAFIAEQNRITDTALDRNQPLVDAMVAEIAGRLDMARQTPASVKGEYRYYQRDIEDLPRPLHCRSKGGVEEILFDENGLEMLWPESGNAALERTLPADVRFLGVNPDQSRFAVVIDWLGDERYQLWIGDIASGELTAPCRYPVSAEIAWVDSRRFICLQVDDRNRPCLAFQYTLGGEHRHKPRLLFSELDESFSLSIRRSASGSYVFLTSTQLQTSNEVYLLHSAATVPEFVCFARRQPGVLYYLTHHGEYFYVLSNQQGENRALSRVRVDRFLSTEPALVIDCDPAVELYRLQAFQSHLVLYQRRGQRTEMLVVNPESLETDRIALPDNSYTVSYADNLDFDSHIVRFFYASLIVPDRLYAHDMVNRKLAIEDQLMVKGYDWRKYRTESLEIEVEPGVHVPVSLVYREDLRCESGNPLLLYGYGAYGYSLPVDFTSLRLSLLDRGFIYAIAHVRGGGELGPGWHRQGKRHNKPNSFTDFIACADNLVSAGYTTADQLALMGESAGGLLVTAALNLRPDLCRAVVAINPFVDVISTLQNTRLPGTTEEWVEWGNPASAVDLTRLRTYSPLENIQDASYPDMLLICSLHDAQVPYWEACKYRLRLAEQSQNNSEILLRVRDESGHQGISDRYRYIEEEATVFAYLVHKLMQGRFY